MQGVHIDVVYGELHDHHCEVMLPTIFLYVILPGPVGLAVYQKINFLKPSYLQ